MVFIGLACARSNRGNVYRQLSGRHGTRTIAPHVWLVPALLTICLNGKHVAGEPRESGMCEDCHAVEAQAFDASVHRTGNFRCHTCHYRRTGSVASEAGSSIPLTGSRPSPDDIGQIEYDHGPGFLGKPSRFDIPMICGGCHSDVTYMNPYGLPTDQLSQYRVSGHGKAVLERHDERAAVCTDCHGVHEVLARSDPASLVYPQNVPGTCGRCHADPSIMEGSGLPTSIVPQYLSSVHGRRLIEEGDTGMPHCATCHGSHSAVPPGYEQVGHICGECHRREEENFQQGVHGRFPQLPRCIGCHSPTEDLRNHAIAPVAARPPEIKEAYAEAMAEVSAGADEAARRQAYAARREPRLRPFQELCRRCHANDEPEGEWAFFANVDKAAIEYGQRMYEQFLSAEMRYASVARRVDRLGRGVLLVDDEHMMLEALRTQLVSLGPALHRINITGFDEQTDNLQDSADKIDASLDAKVAGLRWRRRALIPIWLFIAAFSSILWVKYKRLKSELVTDAHDGNGGGHDRI
jgi:hypothetical protein